MIREKQHSEEAAETMPDVCEQLKVYAFGRYVDYRDGYNEQSVDHELKVDLKIAFDRYVDYKGNGKLDLSKWKKYVIELILKHGVEKFCGVLIDFVEVYKNNKWMREDEMFTCFMNGLFWYLEGVVLDLSRLETILDRRTTLSSSIRPE